MITGRLIHILLVLFVSLKCSQSNNSQSILWSDSIPIPSLSLDYGLDSGANSDLSFEPGIVIKNSQACFYSRHPDLLDFGPRLGICFEESLESQFSLEWLEYSLIHAKQALLDSTSLNSFPRFTLQHEAGEVYFDFITESSLKNLWKKSPPKNFLLGDLRLKKLMGENYSFRKGLESFHLSFSYGLPYWNYYGGEECFFFMSSWDLDIPANQKRVLRIQMDCSFLESHLDKLRSRVQIVHEFMTKSCKEIDPILTEYFSHGTSKYNRYLEIHNPNEYPLCKRIISVKQENFESGNKNSIWEPNWEFIFPHSTILLSTSDSGLHSYDWLDDYDWSRINIGDSVLENFEIIPATGISQYRFEDEFISLRYKTNPCSVDVSNYYSSEKFCGSPGIHKDMNLDLNDFCSPDDVILTEINFWGIQDSNGNLNSRDRYLEFQVSLQEGRSSCDISSLYIDIENEQFPLKTLSSKENEEAPEKFRFKNSEIFIVSLSNKMPIDTIRFPRNLFLLNPARSISIGFYGIPEKKKIIWDPRKYLYNSDLRILPKDSRSNLFSLVLSSLPNEKPTYIHHNRVPYYEWSSSLLNFMSPGTLSEYTKSNLHGLTLSEVLWAGSYKNRRSILTDRFIEWKTNPDTTGSFFLSIIYPNAINRNQTYLVPIERNQFTYLSRKSLVCFPRIEGIYHSRFSLFHDSVRIVIQDEKGSVHQDLFLDTDQFGLNQTSQRFRASAIYFPMENTYDLGWRHSGSSVSECEGEVAASPGAPNVSNIKESTMGLEN